MEISVRHEILPLQTPFRISRGVKTVADVVVAEAIDGHARGWGEAVPYARYGETVDSVMAQLHAAARHVAAGAGQRDLASLLPPGAARNALDCALWDLAAKQTGRRVWQQLNLAPPGPAATAQTIVIGPPDAMAAAAARQAGHRWLKLKLDRDDVLARLQAVHRAAPKAALIVDANEAWDIGLLHSLEPALWDLGVRLLEQPLPAAQDAALAGFARRVPVCADESCHTAADLPRLAGRYDYVNIKLDKTGGLTGACQLMTAARAAGFGVMLGCMVATSLSMAPAMLLAGGADVVDLDGPLWLAADRPGGMRYDQGTAYPPAPGFWG